MSRSPSTLRDAGSFVTSGVSSPGVGDSDDHYGGLTSPSRVRTGAADHSRHQVQSALRDLLDDTASVTEHKRVHEDDTRVDDAHTARTARPRQPGCSPRSLKIGLTETEQGSSPSKTRKPTSVLASAKVGGEHMHQEASSSEGNTPSRDGTRRRRSNLRSPKSYSLRGSPIFDSSTLEGLQVSLDGKQQQVVNAHMRRTRELEMVLAKEEQYLGAILEYGLEKIGVKLKATSAMLKGQKSSSNSLFRRGSRRLSSEGVDDVMQMKHSEEAKKADHLRKKLRTHHEEARIALAKKLQVESTRMGRVVKTNLGKYANPNLAQGAKSAVLASISEYLNGEEFLRIVTASLNYKSPDFLKAVEEELGANKIKDYPTDVQHQQRLDDLDYDAKLSRLRDLQARERKEKMDDEARQYREALVYESKLAMEREAAEAREREVQDMIHRDEEIRRKQSDDLREHKRQLESHQENLRKEAELTRARYTTALQQRRQKTEVKHAALLTERVEAKQKQKDELARELVNLQQKHDDEIAKHQAKIMRQTDEVARREDDLAPRRVLPKEEEQFDFKDLKAGAVITYSDKDEDARGDGVGEVDADTAENSRDAGAAAASHRYQGLHDSRSGQSEANTSASFAGSPPSNAICVNAAAVTSYYGVENSTHKTAVVERATTSMSEPGKACDDIAEPVSRTLCAGDKVEALCTPIGAPPGSKAYISGEVAYRNPDGSLDVILSDGRIRPDVPLQEIRCINIPHQCRELGNPVKFSPEGLPGEFTSFSNSRCKNEPRSGRLSGNDSMQRQAPLLDTRVEDERTRRETYGAPCAMVKGCSLNDILMAKTKCSRPLEASRVPRPDDKATRYRDNTHRKTPKTKADSNLAQVDSDRKSAMDKRRSLDDILQTKMGDSAESSVRISPHEGIVVEAVATARIESSSHVPGEVTNLSGHGRENNAVEDGKPAQEATDKGPTVVRQRNPSTLPCASARDTQDFNVGDRVEARYGADLQYLPGVVTSTEDGLSINFDAGWHGATIPLRDVKREGEGSSLPTSDLETERNPSALTPGARMRSMASILDLDVGSLGGDSAQVGDQVQVRDKILPGEGLPLIQNGVVRAVHPNGTYLVGLSDGSTRDQIPSRSITAFDWTSHESASFDRAAGPAHEYSGSIAEQRRSQNESDAVQATNDEAKVRRVDDEGRPASFRNIGNLLTKVISRKVTPMGLPPRRGTHAGSGEQGLALEMLHFKRQAYMDPDTASQAILTPNNAGMFRPRRKDFEQSFAELSDNSTTYESDRDESERTNERNFHTNQLEQGKLPSSGCTPTRRMTFAGLRSDTRGDIYTKRRRPSFLAGLVQRTVKVAERATRATRRLSINGNDGIGFELVPIEERRKSLGKSDRRRSMDKNSQGSGDTHSENETHFHNRLRHVFEPQHTELAPSAWWIRVCGIINLLCMAVYLWWRFTRSLIGLKHVIWAYIFLAAECIMAIGMIVGHSSRSFPVHREKIYMDDLEEVDTAIGSLKAAVLIPTCGEKTGVMLKALFGNLQLRLWKSQNSRRDTLRIIVLDEKRREEIQKLVSLVYTLCEVVLDKTVREILMREGVAPISAKGFYDHFTNGENGQRIYDDVNFIRGIEIVVEIDTLIAANDDSMNRFSPSAAISRIKERARRASCFERKEIQAGQKKVWNRNKYIPTIVYYSRIDAGQPRISPKAGNMNRAIFSFNPHEEPLIGQAAVVVVNDVRHELYPEFLQRTLPYFFTFDKRRRCYKWTDVAFIQTPQRFHDHETWNDPDPLGNQAATQFDIVNSGRDGAGGALSCGQGSVWRVQVLRDGIRPDGSKCVKKSPPEDQVGVQGGLGFRSEVLIEDTHTSIDLFRMGWKSVYVSFPKGATPLYTTFRWHQGAVQLAMWKGWKYAFVGEHWGTFFQRVFAFDAISYFLQAFAGEILLIFPVVYGFTNSAPFNTWDIEFALYFFPFIITGVLPTAMALGWSSSSSSSKVMRDEQIWFATSFVQIYAVLHAVWSTISRKDPANAWNCKCPVWPLYAHFLAIIVAACYNTAGWVARNFEEPWVWVSCIGASVFGLHSLWPVVSFGLGVTLPPAFYTRVFGMLTVMTLVSLWLLGEGGGQSTT